MLEISQRLRQRAESLPAGWGVDSLLMEQAADLIDRLHAACQAVDDAFAALPPDRAQVVRSFTLLRDVIASTDTQGRAS